MYIYIMYMYMYIVYVYTCTILLNYNSELHAYVQLAEHVRMRIDLTNPFAACGITVATKKLQVSRSRCRKRKSAQPNFKKLELTDRQTDRPSTVTLAAHACRGLTRRHCEEDCCMLSILLTVPSYVNSFWYSVILSFWHGIIPTSEFDSCFTHFYGYRNCQ